MFDREMQETENKVKIALQLTFYVMGLPHTENLLSFCLIKEIICNAVFLYYGSKNIIIVRMIPKEK